MEDNMVLRTNGISFPAMVCQITYKKYITYYKIDVTPSWKKGLNENRNYRKKLGNISHTYKQLLSFYLWW